MVVFLRVLVHGRSCSAVARTIHTGPCRHAVDKAQLSKLRKQTGISFVNCKKALEKFDNDLAEAEQWLRAEAQKEGWTKASKLQSRPMSQGLVGVILDNNVAAMVEVNCETDFVARNSKFQKLVSHAANAVLQHGRQQAGLTKILMNNSELTDVKVDSDKSLTDLVATEIGNIGENMLLRRAAYLRVPAEKKIGSYVHSAGVAIPRDGLCTFGKYGALATLVEVKPGPSEEQLGTEELGRQVCQHIVGMNPQVIGNPDDEPVGSSDEEDRLIFQEFLLEPALTVGELLNMNFARVEDFIRFECGEEIRTAQSQSS